MRTALTVTLKQQTKQLPSKMTVH